MGLPSVTMKLNDGNLLLRVSILFELYFRSTRTRHDNVSPTRHLVDSFDFFILQDLHQRGLCFLKDVTLSLDLVSGLGLLNTFPWDKFILARDEK